MTTEEWRDVGGYEGYYQVSDLGRVRSVDRNIVTTSGITRPLSGRVLSQSDSGMGYLGVTLSKECHLKTIRAHRLVLDAFRGRCPDGMESCHNDGNRKNNRLANLRWDTLAANQADRLSHKTSNRGERHGMSKLKNEDVRGILMLLGDGNFKQYEIASLYDVSSSLISIIKHGRAWSWLSGEGACKEAA